MMYQTHKARESAVNEISRLYVKLAETKPTDQWFLQDIVSVMHYLSVMKEELQRNIKDEEKLMKKFQKENH